VNFTNTSLIGSTYTWDFGDGTPTSSVTNPSHIVPNQTFFLQNYTVTLIAVSVNGCSDTTTQVIQSFPEALFSFNMVPDSGCTPLNVALPAAAGAVLYQWDFGDGSNGTGAAPTHVYSSNSINDTTFTIELIATNAFNCIDTTYGVVTVFGKPAANFVASSNSGCPNFNVNFTNSTAGATQFLWDFDDGSSTSSLPSPSHLFSNSSTTSSVTYNTSLVATNIHGCSDTVIKPITVFADVLAAFAADTPICAPVNLIFANNSVGSDTYFWTFGDGNSSSNATPSHLYNNSGSTALNYVVTLIATNSVTGCDDTVAVSYNVYPNPNVSFTATPASQIFPSSTVTTSNTTTFLNSWSYSWNYGDSNGSTLTQPGPYTYTTTGTYTISLIASSLFCSDTATQVVTILPPPPVADFIGSFQGCRPLTVSFTNTTQFSQFVTSYQWNFGDGGISNQTDPTYTYYNPGTYTVSLTATGPGGTSSVVGIDSVIVYPVPVAAFVASPTTVYIPNGILSTVNLTTGASTYLWDFGDGVTSSAFEPQHTYQTEGDYSITLIATSVNNCKDTFVFTPPIHAELQSEIQVPNAFSPNQNSPSSDGIFDPNSTNNDIFHPVLVGIKTDSYELRIYNRWGELMFATEDTNIGWDGYYKGKLCTQDIYIWKITAITLDNKNIKKAGDLLLLR
jgi:gliding motility-associated-like protein